MILCAALALLFTPIFAAAQSAPQTPSPVAAPAAPASPPVGGGFFPLSEVHRGLTGTAWTVFSGSRPEPMDLEILGVLKGARGPGHDMILAQLRGARPEYTGVAAGMSGSPVYIGNRLLGALSYRIGQFSKDPIAGITPIEQMLEVLGTNGLGAEKPLPPSADNAMRVMETPLVMGGFHQEAIRLWQQKMVGTGLETVAAGGMSGSSGAAGGASSEPSAQAIAEMMPGSAVSAQLVRGDLEIAATCTVTYMDRKQLLACGHPILQSGPLSLPMTAAEVVTTLASPLNAFKIVNTGATIGAFTEDRDAAIRCLFKARARMIPLEIRLHGADPERTLKVEIAELPSIAPQAVMVVLYEALLQSNASSAEMSYHLTGSIDFDGYPPSPLDLWAAASDSGGAQMEAAQQTAIRFARLYSNGARQGGVRGLHLDVEEIPHRIDVALDGARLVGGNIVHAGDTVVVEATLRPWHQEARNVRIEVKLPARLTPGNLRLLVSDAGTLDRTLDQPRQSSHSPDMNSLLNEERRLHPADRVYVSLLTPETQAGLAGQTLTTLPLSVANALEPMRSAQDASLNGESAEVEADSPAGGLLSGFQLLNLRIEPGGGLN